MSGGGGGRIIINRIAEDYQGNPVSTEDQAELMQISDRSNVHCSLQDTFRVIAILWKYLRGNDT